MTTATAKKSSKTKQANKHSLGDLSSLANSAHRLKRNVEKQKEEAQIAGKPIELPLGKVKSRKQSRKKFRYIERLAETIKQSGLQQPIVVFKEGDNWVIQNGERRYRAFKLLKKKTIPAVITDKREGLHLTTAELLENLQRDALTASEISDALIEYREEGMSQQQIADEMGRSVKWVSIHLGINELPEQVADLHDAGYVEDADTLNELRKLHEVDPGRCEAICASAIENGLTRKDAAQAVSDAKATMAAMEADKNRPKDMAINSQEQAADALANQELKDAGLDEVGLDTEGAGSEDGAGDEPATLKPYSKTEPSLFTLKVRVLGNKPYEALVVTDRLDNDPSFVWVKRFKKGGKTEYKRIHCQDLEVLGVEQRVV